MDYHDFSRAFQEEWWVKHMLLVSDVVDEEMRWHPWLFFALSLGCLFTSRSCSSMGIAL